MSGGGGGVIIIRTLIRQAAGSDSVRDNIHHSKCKKLDAILAKADADWTDNETHYALRCIADAYDSVS
jgi:hypothetical protein